MPKKHFRIDKSTGLWIADTQQTNDTKESQESSQGSYLARYSEVSNIESDPEIILVSKRGSRKIDKKRRCDECRRLPPEGHSLMHYSKSNVGSVAICDRCLGRVQDRSWKQLDALDYSLGGGTFSPK